MRLRQASYRISVLLVTAAVLHDDKKNSSHRPRLSFLFAVLWAALGLKFGVIIISYLPISFWHPSFLCNPFFCCPYQAGTLLCSLNCNPNFQISIPRLSDILNSERSAPCPDKRRPWCKPWLKCAKLTTDCDLKWPLNVIPTFLAFKAFYRP